jgi:hypothetical protein
MRKKRRKISSRRVSLAKRKTFGEKERVPLMMKRTW